MAVKPLAADSKLVVYNNEVDLADKGVSQVYQGATIADVVAASGAGAPVASATRPVFDASKAGDQVFYNGVVWKYLTTDDITALGWTGLVTFGYPAPLNMSWNPILATEPGKTGVVTEPGNPVPWGRLVLAEGANVESTSLDLFYLGNIQKVRYAINVLATPATTFTAIHGAELLSSLQDSGTKAACQFVGNSGNMTMDAAVIDQFFEDLPTITQTATISFFNVSGQGACDPTIATAKGWTIVV